MSEPTFLPLLNSIAVNETKGEILLKAWADATNDEALEQVLRFVSIREGEHAWAFTKRMCELGHAVCEETAFQFFKDFDELVTYIRSDATDAEKVARTSRGGDGKDPFASFFNDTSIDPQTGGLLGRYIAEERDSGRRLKAEYDRICAAAGETPASELDELKACVAGLQKELADLKRVRSAA
ncbi:MAG: hypothetical protein O7E57_02755 [Gammaproteobacteria bacterium]|nr:hypothetical protein [Gammaproteobacteria bacterium]